MVIKLTETTFPEIGIEGDSFVVGGYFQTLNGFLFDTSISIRCSVIHCIMEKSGTVSAMKTNSLFSKNVLSLVLVIGCPLYVCLDNNIRELPKSFFNYQIANLILHYRIMCA